MESSLSIRDVLQALLNARKIAQTYPENNRTYIRTLDVAFGKLSDAIDPLDALAFQIKQHQICFGGEPIDCPHESLGSVARLLYKEGLREVSFKKGLPREEFEAFLKVVSIDERGLADIDLVTLLWEKDFKHISYTIDEIVLSDEEYDPSVTRRTVEEPTSADEILGAYRDAFNADEVEAPEVPPLSESDFEDLAAEIERDSEFRFHKFVNLLFELWHTAEDIEDCEEIESLMKSVINYSIRKYSMADIVDILQKLKLTTDDESIPCMIKISAREVIEHVSSPHIITSIGALLDSGEEFDEDALSALLEYIGSKAIPPFIDVLGNLQKISARKRVISMLGSLGKKNIEMLLMGISDDRWFVVRNIVCAVRLTGDKRAGGHLIDAVSYPDVRVKKESIRTLGELRIAQAIPVLKRCLDDPDPQIRTSAVTALKCIRTEDVKQALVEHIRADNFIDKEYEEKKYFFECLALWREEDVAGFLAGMMNRQTMTQTIVKRRRTYESRACAAYALGLLGDKRCLDELRKHENSGNAFFRGHVQEAIRRLEETNE